MRNHLTKLRTDKNFELKISRNYPDNENDADLWKLFCNETKPLLSVMLGIQQRTLEKLIDHQSNWFIDDVKWFQENLNWLFPWIYSSLVCLRLPLEPNVHNSLRKITKNCILLRNQFCCDDIDIVLPLNLIICIVSQNFNQLDLSGRIR